MITVYPHRMGKVKSRNFIGLKLADQVQLQADRQQTMKKKEGLHSDVQYMPYNAKLYTLLYYYLIC